MTSTRRLHRIAALTAVSVLFAITSTVSALASGTEDPGAPSVAAPAPVAVSVAAGLDQAPAGSTVAKAVRPAVVARTDRPVVVTPKAVVAPKAVVTPTAVVTAKAVVTPKAVVIVAPVRTTIQDKPAGKPAAPVVVAAVEAAKAVTARPITISSYVDAPGSQAQIDKCHLVLWSHHPLWLAGHNWCGFQWMAYVPEGTTVRVSGGAAAGTYVVTGHLHLTRQGGPMMRTGADLVLQTCIGSGTGLTLLRRL